MRIGTRVKDHNGETGLVAEVFYDLVPIRNRFYGSRRVISAYLIRVSNNHWLYRSKDKVRRV